MNYESGNFYWLLGYMLADGSLGDNDLIQFGCKTEDEELLRLLKCITSTKAKIIRRIVKPDLLVNSYRNRSQLGFIDHSLAKWLRSKGVVERKTGKEFYTSVPDTELLNLLRGFVDGDGNISGSSIRIYSKGPIVLQFMSDVNRVYSVNSRVLANKDVNLVSFNRKDCDIIAPVMYGDGLPCLARKKEAILSSLNKKRVHRKRISGKLEALKLSTGECFKFSSRKELCDALGLTTVDVSRVVNKEWLSSKGYRIRILGGDAE